MDLQFSPDELSFREEVRNYVRENLPAGLAEKCRLGHELSKEDCFLWQRILAVKGWTAPAWPEKFGGPGWTATQRYIFDETIFEFDVPVIIPFGTSMVGPVIYTFGNQAQKERYLPKILSGEHWWCQGYSEPGSGSDLASLTTRADREGDEYVVSGTKIWTTLAHWADWMFCLVRTDSNAKPQEGISFLLIDMASPRINVEPIISIDNLHHLNMVHFDEVRVPVVNRIGEENRGWDYAKFLLTNERTSIAEVGLSKRRVRYLKEIAKAEAVDGKSLLDVDEFMSKVAATEIELSSLEVTNLRYLAEEEAGQDVGPRASLLKIKGAEIRQQLTELSMEAVGMYALAYDPARSRDNWNEPAIGPDYAGAQSIEYLFSRAATIYGGSNEIQRNIMAKMVLGL